MLRDEKIPISEFQKDLLHDINMFAQFMKERGLDERSGKEWFDLFLTYLDVEEIESEFKKVARSIRPNCKWCNEPLLVGPVIDDRSGRYLECCGCGAINYLGQKDSAFRVVRCLFEGKEVYNE